MARGPHAGAAAREGPVTLSGELDVRRPAMVTLRVADLDRALRFWNGVLGVPLKLRVGGLAELQTETVIVVLQDGEPKEATLTWEVGDLDAACEVLRARGIDVADAPPPPGVDPAAWGRRAWFADPDGHRLELASWP